MCNGPESLQFHPIVHEVRKVFEKIPDSRVCSKVQFPLVDVVLSGLAMMFWQDPGVLPFQQRLQDQNGSSNLKTMFQVQRVPGETQFRNLLDLVAPSFLLAGLRQGITLLQKTRSWKEFRCLDGRFLVALDGTEYLNSEKVHCKHCLERHHRDGRVEYYHQVLVASLIHPRTGQSFPLWAEEIRREDGTTKQDCENNAAIRLLPELAKKYCHLDIILLADSLYSKSPIITLARSLHMDFIFVAKPGDHVHLQEQLVGLRLAGGITSFEKDGQGKIGRRVLEIALDVPLFASTNVTAHWLEYSERTTAGKPGYHNGWVTSIKPTSKNCFDLVMAGRHRSSIENQTFNALKNHGHHFEHNFGHGKKNLRFNFAVLNLLAFLMHQLLSIGDALYIEAKTWKKTVRELYEYIRIAIRLTLWPDWPTLMNHYIGRGPIIRVESG